MMINTIYNSKSQKGFTIVELVLTIAIIGLLSTVVGPIIMNAMRGYTLVSARRSTLAETRQAMERMISDIQRIPSSNAIDIFTPNALQFDILGEDNILYNLSGTMLQRSGFDFADDIISLTFSYLDINGAPTSTKALIWQIAVEMIVTSEDAGIFQIKTRIFPRQFFDTYGGFQ